MRSILLISSSYYELRNKVTHINKTGIRKKQKNLNSHMSIKKTDFAIKKPSHKQNKTSEAQMTVTVNSTFKE